MLSNMLTSSKLGMVLQTEYNFNKPFLKTGMAYETGSGFGESGSTPATRIPRSTPPALPIAVFTLETDSPSSKSVIIDGRADG